MKRVLIYIDEDAVEDSIDLLEVCRLMYGNGGFCSYALAVGSRYGDAGNRFDHVFLVKNGQLPNYDSINLTHCIEKLHRNYHFDAILFPATHCGRMIAPRAAMRLHARLIPDITEIEIDGDGVMMVRLAFNAQLLSMNLGKVDRPIIMSARSRAFIYEKPVLKSADYMDVDLKDMKTPGIRMIEHRKKTGIQDIRNCDVLISGGGGVIRDFPLLERLAEKLHGMVAASRMVVDLGKAPRAIQVGQSGKSVSPRLYIAVGISGSTQHVAGIRNAEYIISVNTNRQAPICSISDIVVEGDSRAFIEGLLERIELSKIQTKGKKR